MADIESAEERRMCLYVTGITSAVGLWPSGIIVPVRHEAERDLLDWTWWFIMVTGHYNNSICQVISFMRLI